MTYGLRIKNSSGKVILENPLAILRPKGLRTELRGNMYQTSDPEWKFRGSIRLPTNGVTSSPNTFSWGVLYYWGQSETGQPINVVDKDRYKGLVWYRSADGATIMPNGKGGVAGVIWVPASYQTGSNGSILNGQHIADIVATEPFATASDAGLLNVRDDSGALKWSAKALMNAVKILHVEAFPSNLVGQESLNKVIDLTVPAYMVGNIFVTIAGLQVSIWDSISGMYSSGEGVSIKFENGGQKITITLAPWWHDRDEGGIHSDIYWNSERYCDTSVIIAYIPNV